MSSRWAAHQMDPLRGGIHDETWCPAWSPGGESNPQGGEATGRVQIDLVYQFRTRGFSKSATTRVALFVFMRPFSALLR